MVSRKAKLRTEAPVNGGRNYNGPKVINVALAKSGYLLEQLSISRYWSALQNAGSDNARSAANQQERSHQQPRKTLRCEILRDFTPDARFCTRTGSEDKVRTAWRHAEGGRNDPPPAARLLTVGETKPSNNVSEIPCRVSSDLHEWSNDLGTVSTRGSANL